MWYKSSKTNSELRLKYLLSFVIVTWYVSVVTGRFLDTTTSLPRVEKNDGVSNTPVSELLSKRSQFNKSVEVWKKNNPHLLGGISDIEIEELWRRLLATDPAISKDTPGPQMQLSYSSSSYRKRAPASAQEIAKASDIIDKALEQVNRRNSFISQNPTRNQYTLQNPSSSTRKRGDVNATWVLTDEIRDAAALLAEIDAEELDKNGTLYREYRIAYKDTPDGEVKHKTQVHGQVQARAGNYWLADMGKQHPGSMPFGKNSTYKVFRNVKDYGAVGDGKHDDTKAINQAISDGNRCGKGCGSSTITGATVYFPPGTYLVSTSIIAMYYTQLVSDPDNPAVILAAPRFTDLGVISADVYTGTHNTRWNSDDEWYLDTGNFFRQVRNFIIDLSNVKGTEIKGIHWQVAQATSLQNVHVKMKAGGTAIGVFIENGSGGFISDLTFEGGGSGMLCGNQQFTSRDLIFENCKNAITMLWDWGWIWKGLDITGGEVGINFTTGDFPGGSITVLDSKFSGVKTGILVNQTPKKSDHQTTVGLLNIQYKDVGTMVTSQVSNAKLGGGTGSVASWFIGNTYTDGKTQSNGWSNGALGGSIKIPDGLLYAGSATAGYFARGKEQYSGRSDWVVPTAKGDGVTDDTAALHLAFTTAAQQKRPVFLPAGSYIVTDTLDIPPDTIVVGSCWSQIVASGKAFQDVNKPKVMVRVGKPGDVGKVELSDLLFTATGPTAGLIAMEWNIKADSKGSAALWDCHFRLGGATGTGLQVANCPKLSGVKNTCMAGSLMLHLTSSSSGYFENMWAWVADHDMDDTASFGEAQLDIYVARGILIESTEPTWLYGTASEHSVLYQYALNGAKNVFMGLLKIQTESPYYFPTPSAPTPFEKSLGKFPADPDYSNCNGDKSCMEPWALLLQNSRDIYIVGAGLYSWFYDNYGQGCIEKMTCQKQIVSIDEPSTANIFNLFTVGTTNMLNRRNGKTILAKDNQMLIGKSPWTSTIAYWMKKDVLDTTLSSAEISQSFWDDFPKQCSGIDKCPDTITSKDPNELNLEATKDKGYLCLLEYLYNKCSLSPSAMASGFDRCIYTRMGYFNNQCQDIDNLALCGGAAASTCTDFKDPAVYWMLTVLNQFAHRHAELKTMAFFQSYVSTMTDVYNITDTIMDAEAKEGLGIKKILKILSQVLGFIGAAAPHVPGLSETGKTRAESTGEVVDLMSMVFDASQEHLEEDEKSEQQYDFHKQMETGLGTFLNSTESQLRQNLIDYFQLANISTWPASVFPDSSLWKYKGGDLKTQVAQYFADQRFINPPLGTEMQTLNDGMHAYIKTGLVLLALAESGSKYYILKNAIWMVDCKKEKHYSARPIDNDCYQLHHPGEGWHLDMGFDVEDAEVYSEEIDDKIGKVLDDVSLEMLYTGSVQCQAAQQSYTPVLDGDKPSSTIQIHPNDYNPLGSCIFNLPVIEVKPQETMKPHDSTPCIVLDRQKDGGDPKVGFNILPDYLQDTFTEKFCRTKCAGKTCNTQGCPPPPQKCSLNNTIPVA